MEAINSLGGEFANNIQSSDWKELVHLKTPHNTEDVRKLFYPETDDTSEIDTQATRRLEFLTTLNDEMYEKAYRITLNAPDMFFPDVHTMLATSKQEGKMMSTIMSHVGYWLNGEPAKVGERENNKPPLRKDFLSALEERYGSDNAEKQSIILERMILTHVQKHAADFTNATTESYLKQYPTAGVDLYKERFEHGPWKDLLVMVHRMVGPHFQNEAVSQFNSQDPEGIYSKPTSTITQAMCKFALRIPEIAQNPALQDKIALTALHEKISPLVTEWALEQCKHALTNDNQKWAPSTVELLKAEVTKYKALMNNVTKERYTIGVEEFNVEEGEGKEIEDGSSIGHVNKVDGNDPGPSHQSTTVPAGKQGISEPSDILEGLLGPQKKFHRIKRGQNRVERHISNHDSGCDSQHDRHGDKRKSQEKSVQNKPESVQIIPKPKQTNGGQKQQAAWRRKIAGGLIGSTELTKGAE